MSVPVEHAGEHARDDSGDQEEADTDHQHSDNSTPDDASVPAEHAGEHNHDTADDNSGADANSNASIMGFAPTDSGVSLASAFSSPLTLSISLTDIPPDHVNSVPVLSFTPTTAEQASAEVHTDAGDDIVNANAFDCIIFDDGSRDTIIGNAGDDPVESGRGSDSVDAGGGDDNSWAGAADADTFAFAFARGFGLDTINDFAVLSAHHDKQLPDHAIPSTHHTIDHLPHSTNVFHDHADVMIAADASNSITLHDGLFTDLLTHHFDVGWLG